MWLFFIYLQILFSSYLQVNKLWPQFVSNVFILSMGLYICMHSYIIHIEVCCIQTLIIINQRKVMFHLDDVINDIILYFKILLFIVIFTYSVGWWIKQGVHKWWDKSLNVNKFEIKKAFYWNVASLFELMMTFANLIIKRLILFFTYVLSSSTMLLTSIDFTDNYN